MNSTKKYKFKNVNLQAQLKNGITDLMALKMVPAINVYPLEIAVNQLSQQTLTISGLDKVLHSVEVRDFILSVSGWFC